MAKNIIEDYLVSIGCQVNDTQFKQADKKLKTIGDNLKKIFGIITTGSAAAIGSMVGLTAAIGPAGRALGNITMGVDKLALNLHTTTRNARSLQTVMQAMGIDSLEDLKYINLIPEQRRQFMELRKVAAENAPSMQAKSGLDELKKLGFEFQKFEVKLTSLGTEFLGGLGQALKEPLFKKVPDLLEILLDWIRIIANEVAMFAEKLGNYKNFKDLNNRGYQDLGKWFRKNTLGTEKKSENWGELFDQFTGKGSKKEYQAYALKAAQKNKIDPSILFAQINQESGWNPKAKSKSGALGIGQFMPGTAKNLGINPLNPYQSIDATAKWYKNMMIHYHGNTDAALASYNAGQGATDSSLRRTGKIPQYRETLNYVSSIKSQADKLRASGLNNVSRLSAKASPKTSAQPLGLGGVPGGTGTEVYGQVQPQGKHLSMNVNIHINGAKDSKAVGDEVIARLTPLMNSRDARGFA